ncbi:hypothetical protein IL306_004941 [Fusarium sp. DS 682]|nr:hypothetical protein IL306_004941 [Fusarium sp. DS 682]
MLLFKYILTVLPAALAKDIFVSPNGSNSGSGSSSSPLSDIQAAVNAANPGDTIYLRKGTYRPSKNIHFTKKDTYSKPYTISSYRNEEVIIDGDRIPGTPAALGASLVGKDRGIFHVEKAEYWRFIHITLTKGPYGVYVKDCHNNYFERLSTHSNYETGFHMQNSISNNQIVYLDTYNNADPRNNGQHADGMAIKEGSGAGNIIRGIRGYENADDGIDLYKFKSIASGRGFRQDRRLRSQRGNGHQQANPRPNSSRVRKANVCKRGVLIITSSMSAHIVNVPVDQPIYNGTKAFVTHFGKSLAREWREFARVNIVSPGFFDTKMGAGPLALNEAYRMSLLGRQGHVKKIKGLYLYLASDASTYTTGSDIIIDGGYVLP